MVIVGNKFFSVWYDMHIFYNMQYLMNKYSSVYYVFLFMLIKCKDLYFSLWMAVQQNCLKTITLIVNLRFDTKSC